MSLCPVVRIAITTKFPESNHFGQPIRVERGERSEVVLAQYGKRRGGDGIEVFLFSDGAFPALPELPGRLKEAPFSFVGIGKATENAGIVGIDASIAYRDFMGIALLPGRAAAMFATVFGFVGLLMASLGLYGVLAYTVAQRTREIGIRIALGAAPQRVRAFVLRDGLRLAGIGLAVGFGIALMVTRLLRGLLYGLSPMDPITFGGIGLVLLGVAVIASFLPALRATRISPVEALRSE